MLALLQPIDAKPTVPVSCEFDANAIEFSGVRKIPP
jgi:hypothetical protein